MAARKLTTPSTNIQRGSAACALRTFGYWRVSTDQRRGTGISLDEEWRKIERRCIENVWTLKRVYILAAVKPGDVVVAAKLDRMCGSVMKTRDEMRSRGDWVSRNFTAFTRIARA